jgi:hypothetical protein
MRQQVTAREQIKRGNALLIQIVALQISPLPVHPNPIALGNLTTGLPDSPWRKSVCAARYAEKPPSQATGGRRDRSGLDLSPGNKPREAGTGSRDQKCPGSSSIRPEDVLHV